MSLTVNGLALIAATVCVPLAGRWRVDVTAAPAEGVKGLPLSGTATIELDGVTLTGTVVPGRSAVYGNRVAALIVAGNGGLANPLGERYYKGSPTVRTIVSDILRETGETLAADSDSATLEQRLNTWERSAGPGGIALTTVLAKHGGSWRANLDGSIRVVGAEKWPTVEPPHVLLDSDQQAVVIRPVGAPTLLPGVTFLGQRVRYVTHTLSSSSLTTRASFADPWDLLDRERRAHDRGEFYSQLLPGIVDKQHADGSVDVVVANRFGLTQLPIRSGVPGLKLLVPQGQGVLVGFEGDDGRAPFAALWSPGGSLKLGTILLVASATGTIVSLLFFKPDVTGELALAAAQAAALTASQVPLAIPITTDTAKVI